MARMYVPSTPYTRGEKEVPADLAGEQVELVDGAPAQPRVITVEELQAAADEHGFELVPAEPGGNASTEDWVTFARRKGAEDADLVDEKGEPLKRDALKDKFGSKPES